MDPAKGTVVTATIFKVLGHKDIAGALEREMPSDQALFALQNASQVLQNCLPKILRMGKQAIEDSIGFHQLMAGSVKSNSQ